MFKKSHIIDGFGIKAELEVWNQLEKAFQDEECIGRHHYPMFFAEGSARREIDILFFHRDYGMIVIEVKGLKIDNLRSINGHVWNYEGFGRAQETPYEQSYNQMFMLKKDIESKKSLNKLFNTFSIVALPYITKQQWQEKGFSEKIEAGNPILKDDLVTPKKLKEKILSIVSNKAITKKRVTSEEWNRVKSYFSEEEELMGKKGTMNSMFSKTYFFPTIEFIEDKIFEIKNLLFQGKKLYVFVPNEKAKLKLSQLFIDFIKKQQLSIHVSKESNQISKYTSFIDGVGFGEDSQKLAEKYEGFNQGQYQAVHCEIDKSQIITAGAGTGKTHVMIDRILYLVLHGNVPLKEIVMITFTNKSTLEMKERLETKFLTLFNLTNEIKFLEYAESVKDMQISTIHAYAKYIIQTLSHEIGLGKNVAIRSFEFEKKQVIEQLIEEYFKGKFVGFFSEKGLKYYEFVNSVVDLWAEIEKKGLSVEETKSLNWGTANKNSEDIQKLMIYLINNCDEKLDKLKEKENAITMGDLIRKLKLFTGEKRILQQLNEGCYLFVDEFQDSDNVQIELISKLQEVLAYKLFVVGDQKQSIYRFRGADYLSFDELIKRSKPTEFVKTSLQHNYRSSELLLEKLDASFSKWGKLKLLPYDLADKLTSVLENSYEENKILTIKEIENSYKSENYIANTINDALESLSSKKEKIALIVRTNHEAKKVKQICDDLKIVTSENLDGTFFKTDVVADFLNLLQGLLYPNQAQYALTAINSPYFKAEIPFFDLIQFESDSEMICHHIKRETNDILNNYSDMLREKSVMTVIQKLIYEEKLYQQVYQREKRLIEPDLDVNFVALILEKKVEKYEMNLQHLMTLIESNFDQQNLTVYTLFKWLKLQISVNRVENEPLFTSDVTTLITTVHRSKGLEYDTVIIPYTDYNYMYKIRDFYIGADESSEQQDAYDIGWELRGFFYNKGKNQEQIYSNSIKEKLQNQEQLEQEKEEVRLLYVAFTRAKQRLFIHLSKNKNPNTWGFLLEKINFKELDSDV